jgi:hypothetical protein
MPQNRPCIPADIERQLLIEAGHRCAVCGAELPLERAHIIPWSRSKDHSVENLLCLCANCHGRADAEGWGETTLRQYKQRPWVIRARTQEISGGEGERMSRPQESEKGGKEKPTRFDAFLSHNSQDKPVVREIAKRLREYGLNPWLDVEELRPGLPWQDGLEEAMRTTRAAAVFLAGNGLGSWQVPEIRVCLSRMVKNRQPVIPVLLPGAPAEPEFGLFLAENTWVDLRQGLTEEGLDRLAWGITGKKPIRSKQTAEPVIDPVLPKPFRISVRKLPLLLLSLVIVLLAIAALKACHFAGAKESPSTIIQSSL